MTLPLVVAAMFVGAVVIAAARQRLSSRKNSRPIELGLKKTHAGKN